ncbi:hypothetical protein H4R34_003895, partial [Dimargaris verticillata]
MESKVLKAMEICTEAAVDLEEADEEAQVQELDTCMQTFVDLQKRLEIEKQTLQTLRGRVMAENGTNDETDWATFYQETNQSAWHQWSEALSDREKYGNDSLYTDFRKRVWEINNDGPMPPLFDDGADGSDDDLVMDSGPVSLVCPLTRQLFDTPVKSQRCGHSFSKQAAIAYIRNGHGHVNCPVPGCNHQIEIVDLVRNRYLERKVESHRADTTGDGNDE